MKDSIKMIYENGYNLKQYYSESWECQLDQDSVPMTIVVEVTDMDSATGEVEYKEYPFVFSIGLLNKNIHESIKNEINDDDDGNECRVEDVLGYYGMNCYLDEALISLDLSNKKFYEKLRISEASLQSYTCRFTGAEKQSLKFKTEEDAYNFAEKLVHAYGPVVMALIGFYLDKPINLIGQTAWEQTEKLALGAK